MTHGASGSTACDRRLTPRSSSRGGSTRSAARRARGADPLLEAGRSLGLNAARSRCGTAARPPSRRSAARVARGRDPAFPRRGRGDRAPRPSAQRRRRASCCPSSGSPASASRCSRERAEGDSHPRGRRTRVLRYEDVPDPTPAAGEVLIRLRAASLNHLDVWVRKERLRAEAADPGADGAGVSRPWGTASTVSSPDSASSSTPASCRTRAA